jgi:prophage regulatory protein
MEQQILREKEVIKVVGLSRTSIWRKERLGTFPRRVKLGAGGRAIGWLRSDVEAWLQELKRIEGDS